MYNSKTNYRLFEFNNPLLGFNKEKQLYATVSMTRTYATAGQLTAENYNDDRTEIVAGVNSIIDAQIASGAAIAVTKIAGTAATLTGSETLTNKTLTSPTLGTPTVSGSTATAAAVTASGTDSTIDLKVSAKGNGVTRVSVTRQDDTTDTYKLDSCIQTGWGYVTYSVTNVVQKSVTFPKVFASVPIIIISSVGDSASSTDIANAGNNVLSNPCFKVPAAGTTGFTAQCYKGDGSNMPSSGYAFFRWVAIGQLS